MAPVCCPNCNTPSDRSLARASWPRCAHRVDGNHLSIYTQCRLKQRHVGCHMAIVNNEERWTCREDSKAG